MLKEESLSYYIKQGDPKAKKSIDLRKGRGVRAKNQCSVDSWPGDAKYCFGVATTERTWFFHGSNEKDVK